MSTNLKLAYGDKNQPNLSLLKEFMEEGLVEYQKKGTFQVKKVPELEKRDPLKKAYTAGGHGKVVMSGHEYTLVAVVWYPNDSTGDEEHGHTLKEIIDVDEQAQLFISSLERLTWRDVPRDKEQGTIEVFFPIGYIMHDYIQKGTNCLVGIGLKNGTLTGEYWLGGERVHAYRPEFTTKPISSGRVISQWGSPHAVKNTGAGIQVGAFASAEAGTPEGDILESCAYDPKSF